MGLVEELVAVVGPRHVLVDRDLRAGYEVDWTGRFRGSTPAVVRPAETAEVSAVLAVCARHGAAVVPQGGNTGLVGGGVPLHGEVVLSLRRLDELEPVAADGTVVVGAGVVLEQLQDHAAKAGWAFGVDLAARGSATVGGLVATDAAGLQHLRHGSMRRQVRGVEAVLAGGRVLPGLAGPPKAAGGYDLAGLLTGSEGTLAVLTRVRVALVAPTTSPVTALLGTGSLGAAVAAVSAMRRAGVDVLAAEGFLDDGMRLVCGHLGVRAPVRSSPAYLLVEWDGEVDELATAGAVAGAAAVATDATARAALWRLRDAHSEAVNAMGVPHKLDVGVDPADLDETVAEIRAAVAASAPAAVVIVFGHVADGNLHVNIVGPATDDDAVDDVVLRLVAARRGSISAEHGIGWAKRAWLPLVRAEAELDAYRAIKRALDPAGTLNPHVLVTPPTDPARAAPVGGPSAGPS